MQELKGTVTENTKVADLSAEGGTAPYTFSLEETQDYADFQIVGTVVQAKNQLTGPITKNITVKATDSKQKTKTQTAQIEIQTGDE